MVLWSALALLSAPVRAENVRVCQTGRLRCGAIKAVPAQAPPGTEAAGVPSTGFSATDIASAYNVDTTPAAHVTVAVVAAYGYPAVESDLAVYRSQYNLPACTVANGCLTILNQNGQTTPLPPAPPASDDWTTQSALSLDVVSATCPSCKLLLIEADSDSDDGLFTVQAVAAHAGATVLVNNWGSAEDSTVPALDPDFDLPGVSNFVSTGAGYNDMTYNNTDQAPLFPASSEHVIAVSDTSLVKGGAGRGWTETANNSSGSGCSTKIALPAFQQQAVTTCAGRAYADIGAVGDANTGVNVYNAANGGWEVVGGGGSAVAAGIVAQSGQAGIGPAFFYANPTVFYDITSGTNGTCTSAILCRAGVGWDGPTGNGSLNGGALAALSAPDGGVPEDGGHAAGGAGGSAGGVGGAAGGAAGASAGGAGGAHAGGGSAGASAGGAPGGAGGTAGGTGGLAAGGTSGAVKTNSSSGCGCALAGRGTNLGGGIFVALAFALTVRRRRRYRESGLTFNGSSAQEERRCPSTP
jgi:MYXO-CTERM domain-containing protein